MCWAWLSLDPYSNWMNCTISIVKGSIRVNGSIKIWKNKKFKKRIGNQDMTSHMTSFTSVTVIHDVFNPCDGLLCADITHDIIDTQWRFLTCRVTRNNMWRGFRDDACDALNSSWRGLPWRLLLLCDVLSTSQYIKSLVVCASDAPRCSCA
jgi:hypothetical protein